MPRSARTSQSPRPRLRRLLAISGLTAATGACFMAMSAPAMADEVLTPPISVGSQPVGVAFNPDGTLAYVTNLGDGTLTMIDPSTGTVVGAPIPLGGTPGLVAVTPDGNQLFIPIIDKDVTMALDAHTGAVLASSIPTGSQPTGVAVSPDGSQVWVTDAGDGTVTRINPVNHIPLDPAPFDTGAGPLGVAFTPDSRFAYVADANDDTIDVFDIPTATRVTIPAGGQPQMVAVSNDGSKVYVTNFLDNSVSVFDAMTAALLTTVPVGIEPFGIAITPDGTRAYVAGVGTGTITEIDTANDVVVGTPLMLTVAAQDLAISPDGSRAYVTNFMSADTVTVLALDTPPGLAATTLPDGTAGSAYSAAIPVTGAPAPTLSVTTGSLPSGLTLDPMTGAIAGTPTTAGTSTFTITADSVVSGLPMSTSRSYTITITPAAIVVGPADPGGPARAIPQTLANTGAAELSAVIACVALLLLGSLVLTVRLLIGRSSS